MASKFMQHTGESPHIATNGHPLHPHHHYNTSTNLLSNSIFNTFSPTPSPLTAPQNPSINASPHWQDQQQHAQASRQTSGTHHHARAAAQQPVRSTTVPTFDPANSKTTNNIAQRKEGPPVEEVADNAENQPWTVLDMGGVGFSSLSTELFRYDHLTVLYLCHNKLRYLPPAIASLRRLRELDLSGNQLADLPGELGRLTNLKSLLLFDNELACLPFELGSLYQLEFLGLEGNPLDPVIKDWLIKDGTKGVIHGLRDFRPDPPITTPPPPRDWMQITDSKKSADGSVSDQFSVLCYNILCERYATAAMYGYTPKWALAWEYRQENILRELKEYDTDVICLQEVDEGSYGKLFLPALKDLGYVGVYYQKGRAKLQDAVARKAVDGCATFYKTTRFTLLDKALLDFTELAMANEDLKKNEDFFNRMMPRDNVAVLLLLENQQTGARLIAGNAHVHWDPQFKDVKLLQVALLMEQLRKFADNTLNTKYFKQPGSQPKSNLPPSPPMYREGTDIPVIICGDFNSIPESGVYEYLARGNITRDHDDFMNKAYGLYTAHGMTHPFKLKSAYSNVGELSFTNYTPNFSGVIDYIWYSTNSLQVSGLVGEVNKEYLEKVVGFPNAHFPSDHISLVAQFKTKYRDDNRSSPNLPSRNLKTESSRHDLWSQN
ncbi:Glucose-repressible alcohol dehydrogenase transcriptional effector [Neolecta irregularis DAH-3]|uniref:CCR4-Not complex 3'-5'-exoribonuclease subunit Ccr4 n=1 Tax=Neolecta irregularis (strain DAH-3) TaxID=1198029 RepID=A0A1U7LQM4_NEOID|nr:Glucose-repressible alcohol dehydrogenase transcriptional effector [Neolecta irregularis DAH-3]|eukprot:OLL24883.1 Glucose-repressible alcohol dehydrogenase transcriptional effector [Neolecta irregularis DAH-3]